MELLHSADKKKLLFAVSALEPIAQSHVEHAFYTIAQLDEETEVASAKVEAKCRQLRGQFPLLAVEYHLAMMLIG